MENDADFTASSTLTVDGVIEATTLLVFYQLSPAVTTYKQISAHTLRIVLT